MYEVLNWTLPTVHNQPDGLPDANLNAFKEWNSRSRAVKVKQESWRY